MPVCAAVCDFFTDGAAVCTNMQTAAALSVWCLIYLIGYIRYFLYLRDLHPQLITSFRENIVVHSKQTQHK